MGEDDRRGDDHGERAVHDRGTFLTGATLGLGAVVGAVMTAPALAAAVAPAFKAGSYEDVDLGPAANFPADDQYRIVTFESIPNDRMDLGRRIAFVRHGKDRRWTALSNTCLHVGC